MSVLASLKALLDALLERHHFLLAIAVDRKHSRNAGQRNSSRDRAALDMTMAATHFISDVGRRIFWGVIQYTEAQTNTVAQRSFGDRSGVGRLPSVCGVSSVLHILRSKTGLASRK